MTETKSKPPDTLPEGMELEFPEEENNSSMKIADMDELANTLENISSMPKRDNKKVELSRFIKEVSEIEETKDILFIKAIALEQYSQLSDNMTVLQFAFEVYHDLLVDSEDISDQVFEIVCQRYMEVKIDVEFSCLSQSIL